MPVFVQLILRRGLVNCLVLLYLAVVYDDLLSQIRRIHFIETGKTARWDIYSLNDATPGNDQIDRSFLNFNPEDKDEKAAAEEKSDDANEKKPKFSFFHGRKGKNAKK